MKYGYLVDFIRHDSAEIWGFRYGMTLGLGTPNIMARTGIFGLIVVGLKRFNRNPKICGLGKEIHRARQRAKSPLWGGEKSV